MFSNANVPTLLRTLEPEAIVVYGVATDFCDKYTVEGLLRHWPKAELFLVTDAIRAIYPAEAERLLASWRERGVRFVTAADVLRVGDSRAISRLPCDPPHSAPSTAAYLADLVGVTPNGYLRDVRDQP